MMVGSESGRCGRPREALVDRNLNRPQLDRRRFGFGGIITWSRWVFLVCAAAAVCAGLVWANSLVHRDPLPPLHVTVEPQRLPADGYEAALLTADGGDSFPPSISITENIHGASVEGVTRSGGKWRRRGSASGIVPGRVELRIDSPGHLTATAEFTTVLDDRDSSEDGTPDFLLARRRS